MNHLEAIIERVSRRTYLGEPIDEFSELTLNDLIKVYNSNSGMTSFLLKDGSEAFNSFVKCYGMFKNVMSLIVLKGPKDDTDLKEKTGYYGQKLIIKATQLGLGTCWVGGTFKKDSDLMQIDEAEEVYCVITIGKVPENLTTKEKAIAKLLHMKSKDTDDFYSSDIEYDDLPDYFIMGYKAISKAPTARNTQKVQVSYIDKKTTIHVPDDYAFDMVDLGIAKANFEIATGGYFPLGNYATYSRKKR